MIEPEIQAWLRSLGAAEMGGGGPREALDEGEIPTLVFGGLRRLAHATALIVDLAAEPPQSRAWLREVSDGLTHGRHGREASTAVVLAFTASGLRRLGLPEDDLSTFPISFRSGMISPGRSRALGDEGDNDPRRWAWGGTGKPRDAILILYSKTIRGLSALKDSHRKTLSRNACKIRRTVALQTVPKKGITEPFGFADGISQPVLRGTPRAQAPRHARHEVAAGEFVLGYAAGCGYRRVSPFVSPFRDPGRILPPTRHDSGAPDPSRRDLGRNGTFLVVRELEQDVDAFNKYVAAAAAALPNPGALPRGVTPKGLVAAKMMGRWKDGSSLVRHPDGPKGADVKDNGFLLGAEDPVGLACPLGAHIRRANPRDSFQPGSADQLAITNRHRLLRVGRPYKPRKVDGKPGMLFMCLNADIELQFEVVQQSWLLGKVFHGLRDETDPLVGRCDDRRSFTTPGPRGPSRRSDLANFVEVRGGAYFFLPSRSAIRFLAGGVGPERLGRL